MNRFNFILPYLDPGTGSLLIQFLIAAVFGIILFLKQITQQIKYFISRFFGKKPKNKE